VHVAFALEGVPQRDPSIYSLQVFTNILGGGMSSRLFQEVREIRGLCYSVYAFHAAYADTGVLARLWRNRRVRSARADARRGRRNRQWPPSRSPSRNRALQAQMKAGLLMALESSGARAEQLARQMIDLWPADPAEEIVGKIEAVTAESARAAGRALIGRSRPAIARCWDHGRGLERAAVSAESLGSTRRLIQAARILHGPSTAIAGRERPISARPAARALSAVTASICRRSPPAGSAGHRSSSAGELLGARAGAFQRHQQPGFHLRLERTISASGSTRRHCRFRRPRRAFSSGRSDASVPA